jgi:hypothetical protein
MGWRYDATAADAIPPDDQRPTTILRYASSANVLPISRMIRSPFDCGRFDQTWERAMGQEPIFSVD